MAKHVLTKSQRARMNRLERHAARELAAIAGGDLHLEVLIGRQFADKLAPVVEGPAYRQSVFINCPFDAEYRRLFHALVFGIIRCGFTPRCAKESDDSSEPRFQRILALIEECQFGIHDLSRIELDQDVPRFNMPLELGLFLGAKRYGRGAQDFKSCLIFERDPHSYDKFLSDLSGHDIAFHANDPDLVLRSIRDWLSKRTPRRRLPGGHVICEEFVRFRDWLPMRCATVQRRIEELTYEEFVALAIEWNKASRRRIID